MHREGCLDEFRIHVSLGAPHPAVIGTVPAHNIRDSSIKLGAFCVSQKLPVAVPGGPLQGYVDISGPDALQVRFAPWRLHRRRRFGGNRWRALFVAAAVWAPSPDGTATPATVPSEAGPVTRRIAGTRRAIVMAALATSDL